MAYVTVPTLCLEFNVGSSATVRQPWGHRVTCMTKSTKSTKVYDGLNKCKTTGPSKNRTPGKDRRWYRTPNFLTDGVKADASTLDAIKNSKNLKKKYDRYQSVWTQPFTKKSEKAMVSVQPRVPNTIDYVKLYPGFPSDTAPGNSGTPTVGNVQVYALKRIWKCTGSYANCAKEILDQSNAHECPKKTYAVDADAPVDGSTVFDCKKENYDTVYGGIVIVSKSSNNKNAYIYLSEVEIIHEETVNDAVLDIQKQVASLASELNNADQVNIAPGVVIKAKQYPKWPFKASGISAQNLINGNRDGLDGRDNVNYKECFTPNVGSKTPATPYATIQLVQESKQAMDIEYVRLTNGIEFGTTWSDKAKKQTQPTLQTFMDNMRYLRVFQTSERNVIDNKNFFDKNFDLSKGALTTQDPENPKIVECPFFYDGISEPPPEYGGSRTYDCSGNDGEAFKYLIVVMFPKSWQVTGYKNLAKKNMDTFILTEIEIFSTESFHDHINTMQSQIAGLQADVSNIGGNIGSVNLAIGGRVHDGGLRNPKYGTKSTLIDGITDGATTNMKKKL